MQSVTPSPPLTADSAEYAPAGQIGPIGRWSARLARSKLGVGLLSVGESTVVPIPLETILLPVMVAWPRRAIPIALIATLGAVIGSALFYLAGYLLYDPVVEPALRALGVEAQYEAAVERLSGEGFFWTVFIVSLGPAPLQLATLGAGASGMNFLSFLVAIATSRAIRYVGMAVLCHLLGERIQRYRLPKWAIIVGTLAFIAAMWAIFLVIV